MQTLDFAVELARQAGKLLLESFDMSGTRVNYKSDNSAVTKADIAADTLIANAIQEHYPEEDLVSEELRFVYQPLADPHPAVWVIDPLDGTTNFSLGLPFWGVSIARLVDGCPQTAALYFPTINELYSAQAGQGAYLNGIPITSNPDTETRQATFFACCSRSYRHYAINVPYKHRILGSAAYNYCSVAQGMAILAFEANPKIWDFAAGWLMVLEAGGIIETFDGSQPFPLLSGSDYRLKSFPTLAAASPEIAEKGRQQIRVR